MANEETKKQQHIKAWKKLRDKIFVAQDGQPYCALFPDSEYVINVKKAAANISSEDIDLDEFKNNLRNSATKIASQFSVNTSEVLTKLDNIYDLTAYSLVYGARTVCEIQVALLEYFMDFSRVFFGDTIWILDLGSGTGAAFFGAVTFFKKYSEFRDHCWESVNKRI